MQFDHWTLEDADGQSFCCRLPTASPDGFVTRRDGLLRAWRLGRAAELAQVAALLPDPERFCASSIDACRTNILPLFEAVACENPYPARYFPERNFNQMVLKAMFN